MAPLLLFGVVLNTPPPVVGSSIVITCVTADAVLRTYVGVTLWNRKRRALDNDEYLTADIKCLHIAWVEIYIYSPYIRKITKKKTVRVLRNNPVKRNDVPFSEA